MKPLVFISKALDPASPFQQRLVDAGWAVMGTSLLNFQAVGLAHIPACDWIFFYSKRAVRFLLDQHELPPGIRLAAIGPGTARQIRERGYPVHFVGSGHPETTAAQFLQVAAGQRVLFPRAAQSRRSVQQLLAQQLSVIDRVIYRNTIREDFEIPPCAYLVFTSPLNAQAYFQRYAIAPWQRVIAIGPTTAQKLTELGVKNTRTSSAPTEEKLAETVLNWDKMQPWDPNTVKPD